MKITVKDQNHKIFENNMILPEKIYSESGIVNPEVVEEVDALRDQIIANRVLVEENIKLWENAASEEEQERLFREGQLLHENYDTMMDKLRDLQRKNTPLVNRVLDSLPRKIYNKSGEADFEAGREVDELKEQAREAFRLFEENLSAIERITSKEGDLSEVDRGEVERLFEEGELLRQNHSKLLDLITQKTKQNMPWLNKAIGK